MIAEILVGVFFVAVGSVIKSAVLPKPGAVCMPDRGCQLTGAYQERHASGEGNVGGYYEQAQVRQESAGHIEYRATQPVPRVEPENRKSEWWMDTSTPREESHSQLVAGRTLAEAHASSRVEERQEVAQYVHVRLSR